MVHSHWRATTDVNGKQIEVKSNINGTKDQVMDRIKSEVKHELHRQKNDISTGTNS